MFGPGVRPGCLSSRSITKRRLMGARCGTPQTVKLRTQPDVHLRLRKVRVWAAPITRATPRPIPAVRIKSSFHHSRPSSTATIHGIFSAHSRLQRLNISAVQFTVGTDLQAIFFPRSPCCAMPLWARPSGHAACCLLRCGLL